MDGEEGCVWTQRFMARHTLSCGFNELCTAETDAANGNRFQRLGKIYDVAVLRRTHKLNNFISNAGVWTLHAATTAGVTMDLAPDGGGRRSLRLLTSRNGLLSNKSRTRGPTPPGHFVGVRPRFRRAARLRGRTSQPAALCLLVNTTLYPRCQRGAAPITTSKNGSR